MNLNNRNIEDLILNNKFIYSSKINIKQFQTLNIHNSVCGDKIKCYLLDHQPKYYQMEGCFVSRYSTYLLFSKWPDVNLFKRMYALKQTYLLNNFHQSMKLLQQENDIDSKILKILNDNPYRLNCLCFVWWKLYVVRIKYNKL